MTLSGSAVFGGTVNGSGIAVLGGVEATLVTDNMVLGGSVELEDNQGTIAQQGNWTIGDSTASTANLRILAASTYVVAGDVSLLSNGTGRISNLGTFDKLDGVGTAMINPLVTNSGTVRGGLVNRAP